MKKKESLNKLRRKINSIDNELILLLVKRFKVVGDIGEYKKDRELPVFDKKRWKKVLATRIKKGALFNLNKKFVEQIYKLIHKEALRIES